MDILSVRLKELRQNKAISQKNIGAAVGISDRAYRAFELGISKPSHETLVALAEYYDVSLDYLTGRSDNPQSHKL